MWWWGSSISHFNYFSWLFIKNIRTIMCMDFQTVCSQFCSLSNLDRTDNQRGGVPAVVMETGVEVWIQGLGEATSAVSINVSLCFCVVEGHWPLLVVQEHTHFLRGFLQVEGDGGASTGAETPTFSPADGPVTAVRAHRDEPLLVDGLPGHAKIPVCFLSNLKHNIQDKELDKQSRLMMQQELFVLFSHQTF